MGQFKQVPTKTYERLVILCSELLTKQTMSERIESIQQKLSDVKNHSESLNDLRTLLRREIDDINFLEEVYAEANTIRQRKAQEVISSDDYAIPA